MENQPQGAPAQPGMPTQSQPPAAPTPQQSKKRSLLWLWITLASLFVVCSALAVFFIFFYPKDKTADANVTPSSDTSTENKTETSDTKTRLAASCLVETDLKTSGITYIVTSILKSGAESGMSIYFADVYFNPDSLNYLSETTANKTFTDASTLYKNASKKEFTFTLQGFEHKIDGAASDMTIATQRTDKAKSQMTSLGIPESRITVLEPKVTSNSSNYDDIDRRIEVGLRIPSTCVGAY